MSRAVSVWSLPSSGVHALQMTNENIGLRIARTLFRSRFAGRLWRPSDAHVPSDLVVDHGMSNARELRRASPWLQLSTQRLVAGSAIVWSMYPLTEPVVIHSPPVRTL